MMATALPEREPGTEQGPVLSHAEGKRLVEHMLQDAALSQATEQGYKDFQEGRFSKLEDVKRRLGDV
ncbi:MAG: hypothetical protein HYY02_03835 [Chloroflexi bacterium]|nr:hypothetical protein [Chloroflexota bacterium]